jgi:hypothetical protein
MKGEFDIKIVRNGRELKHNFNNRILRSGLDFQRKYSVNNTEDSIITHLMFGAVHSEITAATVAMPLAPVDAVPYVDYIKPDFLDTSASIHKNVLVFKYEPQSTVTIRQLATGRKNTTDIGGIISSTYDYFSLANIMENGELSEIVLFGGDSLTVTYTLTVNTATETGSADNLTEEQVAWNLLRANHNWHLAGFNRRMQVAKETLWEYWEMPLVPWIYETNSTVNTEYSKGDYSQVMWQLPDNITTDIAKVNKKLLRTMDFGGPLPKWHNYDNGGGDVTFYNINGKYHKEGTTSASYQSIPVAFLDKYYLVEKHNGDAPFVESITSRVNWNKVSSTISLIAKGSPFAIVLVTLGNKVLKANTDIGYGQGNLGYSDKSGEFRMTFSMSEYTALDKTKPITVTYLTPSGWTNSNFYTLPTYQNGVFAKLTKLQYTSQTELSFSLTLSVLYPTYVYNGTSTAIVNGYLYQEGKDPLTESVWSFTAKDIGNTSYTPYDNIANGKVIVEDGVDYLDGTWKFHITYTGTTVSYELGLSELISASADKFFTAATGYPTITEPNVRKGGTSEGILSTITISKK